MLLTSVFPAQAGTQTLSLRREAAHWIPALGGNAAEVAVDEHPPLPTLSPSRGERAFYNRVIANIAKQPRGLTRTFADVPTGCFGAMHLAMTRKTTSHEHPRCACLSVRTMIIDGG